MVVVVIVVALPWLGMTWHALKEPRVRVRGHGPPQADYLSLVNYHLVSLSALL